MHNKKLYEYGPLLVLGAVLFFFANNIGYVKEIFRVTQPVLWGIAISYVMNPICKYFMEKTKLPWSLNILLGYILLILVLSAFIWGLAPIIGQNIADLLNSIPVLIKTIQRTIIDIEKNLSQGPLAPLMDQFDLKNLINTVLGKVGVLVNNLSNLLVVFIKGFSQFILGLIISIYMLLNKDPIKEKVFRYMRVRLSPEKERALGDFMRKADKTFGGFLAGKLLDSMIIAMISFVGFMILDAPFPLLLAIIIGITNMIPYFGPLIGGVPVVFLILFIDPKKAALVAIFIIALQQLDGYYIGPKILGETIGVSPFWVILGVTIGGGLYGIVGMILGVPTLALINSEFDDYLLRKEKLLYKEVKESD
ncbi:MAG: AI-2E family transporter [Tissierellia bacterium]|nr:AI-2E family transporter [Tissierellia bacterium]